MTISSKLDNIEAIKSNIKSAIEAKGVTISSSDAFSTYPSKIGQIQGGGISRTTYYNLYTPPIDSFSFVLPSDALDLANYSLYYAFYMCQGITSADLSSLVVINGQHSLEYAFYSCPNLTTVDLSNVEYIGADAIKSAFSSCTGLTSVDLSSLAELEVDYCMYATFYSCTNLTSIDFSNLALISGGYSLQNAFAGCSSLTSLSFPSLESITGYAAFNAPFSGCSSLTSLSFPALKSSGLSSSSRPFYYMLSGVTGCTVHFPSNLQSVIGSWSDVTSGFGGTSTTVLYDLPATT